MSNNKYFDFDLTPDLLEIIEEYKNDTAPIHRDLYMETIRAYSRELPEDQGEEVIDYFYRKAKLT